MDLANLLDVYSQRSHPSAANGPVLTYEFKFRVLGWLFREFKNHEFWDDLYERLILVFGRPLPLSQHEGPFSHRRKLGLAESLVACGNAEYFDFIESVCKSKAMVPRKVIWSDSSNLAEDFVNAVNQFFQLDDLPYCLTEFESGSSRVSHARDTGSFMSRYDIPGIRAYPQIIPRDSEILHETAIKPTLLLLSRPVFTSANAEFVDALKDFRNGDYADCIAKCGSTFESVMKVICADKEWPYRQTDTAERLLTTIMEKTRLESFFKQPMMLIATIRNRLSSVHGAGTEPRDVPKHVAQYTINASASAILLLVEEASR